jgi:Uma2 family endonuclease
MPALTWEEICADRSLADLPCKIETNRYGQIVMSPAKHWQAKREGRIIRHLAEIEKTGEIFSEIAIQTTQDVKVSDVTWCSERFAVAHEGDDCALSAAPELCVEVLSASNTKEEIQERVTFYFAHGAGEVWFCDDKGRMTFHTSPTQTVEASRMFLKFPAKI